MTATSEQLQRISQQGRSTTGILVKAIGMTTATMIAARYLSTLRRQPSQVASYQILATVLIPTFALADILMPIYRTLRVWQRCGPEYGTRYHLSSVLDIRAIASEGDLKQVKSLESASNVMDDVKVDKVSVPLHLVPYHNLEAHREPYDAKWYARLVALLVFAFHAFVTDILWFRRVHYGTRTFLDDFVAITAFGGLIIASMSVAIMFLNTKWQAPERYAVKFEQHCVEPFPADVFINLASLTVLPELQLSLVVGIFLQSMAFFMSRGGFIADLTYGAPCSSFYKSQLREEEKILVPTSHGLEWIIREPRPCHPWNEGGITNTVAILADSGYILAFLSAMSPVVFVLGFLLESLGSRCERLSRIGRKLLWGKYMMINCAGGLYLLLSYGLSCMAVWDITNPRDWEPWMWKDPWADKVWIL